MTKLRRRKGKDLAMVLGAVIALWTKIARDACVALSSYIVHHLKRNTLKGERAKEEKETFTPIA